jgi:hypothetical protein
MVRDSAAEAAARTTVAGSQTGKTWWCGSIGGWLASRKDGGRPRQGATAGRT